MNLNKVFVVLVTMLFVFQISIGYISVGRAEANNIRTTYQILKDDYPEYIQQIYGEGVTDAEIQLFLTDLDQEVTKKAPLTESNFNSVLMYALKKLLFKGTYTNVFDALLTMFGDDIDVYLQTGEIPENLVPLRNAVKESMLSTDEGTSGGVTPGGGSPVGGSNSSGQNDDYLNKVEDQLGAGNTLISLKPKSGAHDVTLTEELLKKVIQANKKMEIDFGGVRISLPVEALKLDNGKSLSIGVLPLSNNQAKEAIDRLGGGNRLVGNVYELQSSTETTVNGIDFANPITVVISYTGGDTSAIGTDTLDVAYYDELAKKWVKMNGVLNEKNQTISFTTNHFSKYAIVAFKSAQEPSPVQNNTFTDLTGHWAAKDIAKMLELGIVSGVSNTQFAPNRPITRAEFTALLARAVGIEAAGKTKSNRFVDVPVNKWYNQVVYAAVEAGLVGGYSANKFGPDDPINREQMAAMIVRAMEYKGRGLTLSEDEFSLMINKFNDEKAVSSWAKSSVATAIKQGIVGGRSDILFAPKANATRAEAAVMILRMYNKLAV